MDSGNRLVCITVPRTRRRVNLARRFELVLALVLEGVDLPRLSVGNWRSTPIIQYSITPRGNSLEDELLPARCSPMQRYRTPGLGSGGLESELFDGFLGLVIQLIVS